MRRKAIQCLFIAIMTSSLLLAGCGKKTSKVETNTVSSVSVVTDSVLDQDAESYIQGIDDKYVVQNAQQIDPAQIIKTINQNNPILADVSVDTSKVDYTVPGTYSVTYRLKVNRVELKKALNAEKTMTAPTEDVTAASETTSQQADAGQSESTVPSSEATDASDTAAANPEDLFEVEIEKNIVIVAPDEAQKLADEGKTVYRDNNEVLQKAETSAAPAEAPAALPEENHAEETVQTNTNPVVQQPAKPTGAAKPVKTETKPMVQTETPKPTKAPTVVHKNEPAEHVHNWVPITKVIHHDEIGHMETIQHKEEGHTERVMVKPASSKRVLDYEVVTCNCGRQFRSVEEWGKHIVERSNAGDLSHYSYSVDPVYKYVEIPAEYKEQWVVDKAAWTEKKWVVDKPAWDETIVTGRRCTICGVQQ